MNFFHKFLFFIIFLFIYPNLYSQSICNSYLNEININTKNLKVDEPYQHQIYSYGFDIYTLFGSEKTKNKIDKRNWDKILEHRKNFNSYNHKKDDLLYIFRNFIDSKTNNFIETHIKEPEFLWIKKDMKNAFTVFDDGFIDFDKIYNFKKSDQFNEYLDKYGDTAFRFANHFFISHINNKSIKDYTDEELVHLFYFNNNPTKISLTIHSFNLNLTDNSGSYLSSFDLDLEPLFQKKTHLTFDFDLLNYFDLDTVNNLYSFDYMYEIIWVNHNLDDISKKYLSEIDSDNISCQFNLSEKLEKNYSFWYPNVELIGRTENIDPDEVNFEVSFYNERIGTKFKVFYNGSFEKISNFNLLSFPFDKQTVQIPLRINNIDSHDVYLSPTISLDGASGLERFVDDNFLDNEFLLSNYYSRSEFSLTNTRNLAPEYIFFFELERKSSYYVFKVIFPIAIILMIVSSVFFIPSRNLESRLTLSVVSFLALIAYIFVIDESIPKLSYLTYLDYYTITAFLLAALPNLWAIFAYRYYVYHNKEHRLNSLLPYLHFAFFLLMAFVILIFSVQDNFKNTASYLSFLN